MEGKAPFYLSLFLCGKAAAKLRQRGKRGERPVKEGRWPFEVPKCSELFTIFRDTWLLRARATLSWCAAPRTHTGAGQMI